MPDDPLETNEGAVHTVNLYLGGVLIVAGKDAAVELTIIDHEGAGSTVKLNPTAAGQVQAALFNRVWAIEQREAQRR